MKIKQIRANAPDSATHYHKYYIGYSTGYMYYKIVDGNLYAWVSCFQEWILDKFTRESELEPL
jgi:hypothetical protein